MPRSPLPLGGTASAARVHGGLQDDELAALGLEPDDVLDFSSSTNPYGPAPAMLRALISRTDVQYIFVDRRLQRLLRSYAEAIGEDRAWLESVFDGIPGEPAIIRHEPGHDTHFHVRFYNPIAEETARRCYSALVQHKRMLPMRYNISHKAKRRDTLIGIAKKYGTTVAALMHHRGGMPGELLHGVKRPFRNTVVLPPRRSA